MLFYYFRDVPIVDTQMGKVRGTKLQSRDLQRDIYAYYGNTTVYAYYGSRIEI